MNKARFNEKKNKSASLEQKILIISLWYSVKCSLQQHELFSYAKMKRFEKLSVTGIISLVDLLRILNSKEKAHGKTYILQSFPSSKGCVESDRIFLHSGSAD